MPKKAKEKPFVYKTTLSKEYGLTPSMIAELGSPDEYCKNPHYKSGPMASLYRIDRVKAFIAANVERVEAAKASRVKRSAALLAFHERRRVEERRRTLDWAANVPIEVYEPLPTGMLEVARFKRPFAANTELIEQKALHAFVRHDLTNYDHLRYQLRDRPGSTEAYHLIRQRTDTAVLTALRLWQAGYAGEPELASKQAERNRDFSERFPTPEERKQRQAALREERAARKRMRAFEQRALEQYFSSLRIVVERPLPATLSADARQFLQTKQLTADSLFGYAKSRVTNIDALLDEVKTHKYANELEIRLETRIGAMLESALDDWAEAIEQGDAGETLKQDAKVWTDAPRQVAKRCVRALPFVIQPFPPTLIDDARRHRTFSDPTNPLQGKALRTYVQFYLTNMHQLLKDIEGHALASFVRPLLKERIESEVQDALLKWWNERELSSAA